MNKIKLFEINLQHNIAIFIDIFRVCDVITPEVEIGGQICKVDRNGRLIFYNVDRDGCHI